MLVAVPVYRIQRFFLHASGWVIGPAAMAAIIDTFRGDFREAGWCGFAATISFCYWMAFHERRDTRPDA